MFKIVGLAFWALFFIVAFRFVWVHLLKDMLEKEMKDDGIKKKK